jgi:hypothetical protein
MPKAEFQNGWLCGSFRETRPALLISNGWNQNRESVYASSILKSNLPEFKIEWICQVAASSPEVRVLAQF